MHVHGAYSFTLPVAVQCAKKFNKKVVFSGHFHPFYALSRPLMGKMFFHLVTRRVLKDIDLVFTINDEDTAQMTKYHNNVVKLPHWSKFETPLQSIEKKKNMILFVGRLNDPAKGAEHLFHLPEGKYDIHLVSKEDFNLRRDMVKHEGVSDLELKQLYQQASLLVVPSRYEAFSYVSIEALSSNTPVVMSDRVRIADYLSDVEGVTVFNYHDYEGFVSAVENTIGKTVNTKEVENIFNPNRIKQIYKEAYLNIVNNV